MSADFNNPMNAGGFLGGVAPQMMDWYGWVQQGPKKDDSVAFARPIDPSVRPSMTAPMITFIPKGRCLSLTSAGTMVPGVNPADKIPVACMLIGSHAFSGDVTGVYRGGNPQYDVSAQVAIKNDANAPFYCLDAGYIFETSEFDKTQPNNYPVLTTLTATYSLDDFNVAGVFVPGDVYVDHIVGVVIQAPAMCGVNYDIQTILLQGKVVPKLYDTWLAELPAIS